MEPIPRIQLGKKGISENFIRDLNNHFKKHKNVKVSVLKSAGHDKQKVKEMSETILQELGKNYCAKTIGFTIALKKLRNVRK